MPEMLQQLHLHIHPVFYNLGECGGVDCVFQIVVKHGFSEFGLQFQIERKPVSQDRFLRIGSVIGVELDPFKRNLTHQSNWSKKEPEALLGDSGFGDSALTLGSSLTGTSS